MSSSEFSIGALAARTGLTPGTLRMWENRFGFPRGTRTESGHRRFGEGDVEMVSRVLEARDSGMSLGAAIDAVQDQRRQHNRASVYAELTQGPAALPHRRFDRHTLVALSHAIEDESLARAERSIVLGAFQHGFRFAKSADRWAELARSSEWCAVVADFDDVAVESPSGPGGSGGPGGSRSVVRVPLPEDSPMRREWSVVCLGPGFAAVLSAWEVPGATPAEASYEAVVSTQRPAVIAAARVLTGVVASAGHAVPDRVLQRVREQPSPASVLTQDADRLYLRAFASLSAVRR